MQRRLLFITIFWLGANLSCGEQSSAPSGEARKSSGEAIQVKAIAEPAQFSYSEKTKLTVSVDHPLKSVVRITDPESISSGGLSIADFGESLGQARDHRLHSEKWFFLEADVKGSYRIPPLTLVIKTEDQGEIRKTTDEIFVTVTAEEPNATAPKEDIRDIKPNIEVASRWPFYFMLAAGGFLILLIGFFLFLWIRHRFLKNKTLLPSPLERALRELKNLEARGLIQKGELTTHFSALSTILRTYLEDQFSFQAVEMTTEEISSKILAIKEFDHSLDSLIADFLKQTDLIKFAKSIPGEKFIQTSLIHTRAMIEKAKAAERETSEIDNS